LSDLISVIIPVYNESTNIDEMVERLKASLIGSNSNYEVWFIDDGSNDGTFEKVKLQRQIDPSIKCVSFSRNFGHHNAIAAGIDYAQGNTIVLMDGDLQDRPESIPALLDKLSEGYDVVCARRSETRGSSMKKVNSSLFWKFIKLTSGLELIPDQSIMRVFNRPVLNSLKQIKESNRFYSALFNWVGFKQTGLVVQYDERGSGKTKYTFKKQLKLAMDAIFGFGKFPLWILMILGLVLIILGLFVKLPNTLLSNPLVLLGAISMLFGLASYQVRQAMRDTRERPLYVVKEILGHEG